MKSQVKIVEREMKKVGIKKLSTKVLIILKKKKSITVYHGRKDHNRNHG